MYIYTDIGMGIDINIDTDAHMDMGTDTVIGVVIDSDSAFCRYVLILICMFAMRTHDERI